MRFLTFFVILLTAGSAVFADTEIIDRYWSLFMDGDIPAIEQALDDLDRQVRQGELGYGNQRKVYRLFRTTHPKITTLLDRWLDGDPTSRHALAGRLSQHLHIAFIERGGETSRWTHPKALALFRDETAKAHEIASRLYQDDPGFVPGSDAVLSLMKTFGGRENAEEYLDAILSRTHSRASLYIGVTAFDPSWGGSYRKMAELCQRFAAQVRTDGIYNADICIADAVMGPKLRDRAFLALAQRAIDAYGDAVNWDARFADATYHRPDVAKVLELFDEAEAIQSTHAHALRTLFWQTQSPEIGEILNRARRMVEQEWERALVRDPLNPTLIAAHLRAISLPMREFDSEMRSRMQTFAEDAGLPDDRTWTEAEHKMLEPLWAELWEGLDTMNREIAPQVADAARDLTHYGRYQHQAWKTRLTVANHYGDNDLRYAMERTVAVYSNFRLSDAEFYVSNLDSRRMALDRMIEAGETSSRGREIDPAAEKKNLACEFVAAARLALNSCERSPDQLLCDEEKWYRGPTQMLADARKEGLCRSNLLAPVEALNFPPPLELEDLR